MASRVDYKRRYSNHWIYSNARELYVLSLINLKLHSIIEGVKRRTRSSLVRVFLEKTPVRAELVGLGAGSTEYIPEYYHGLRDAFDIAILVGSEPCCWIDPTGVVFPEDLKPGLGYCVGTWKLEKAAKYKVVDRTWFAFVVNDRGTARFIKASWLYNQVQAESPRVTIAKLWEDERPVVCTSPKNWTGKDRFYKQLENTLLRYVIKRVLKGPGAGAWKGVNRDG